jgi:formylglycine-generating enzyme required for sulfatase activity
MYFLKGGVSIMRKILQKMAAIATVTVLFLAGCSNPGDTNTDGTTRVKFTGLKADGSATGNTKLTTKLTLTFDKDITGLNAADITLDSGSTGAVKGNLTNNINIANTDDGIYELAVAGITARGSVSVAVSKSGYNITGGTQTVTVYHDDSPTNIAAAFTNLTADGSDTATTKKLTLTFDKDITGLRAADIALDGGSTRAVKGSLTRTGTGVYELAVSGIRTGGSVTVGVSRSGYNITGGAKTAAVYRYFLNIPATFTNLTADGSSTVTTTKLTLTFDKDITDLNAADIALDGGSTRAVKGSLTRTGTGVYELAVSGITRGGSVTVAVSQIDYNITGGPKTATIYRYILDIAAVFTNLTAGGSAKVTTTKLTLTFDKDITGLNAADITLDSGSTGAVKGNLTRTRTTGVYELAVAGITAGGSVSVAVSKSGYTITGKSGDTITGSAKTVTVYHYTANIEMVRIPGGSFQMGNPDTSVGNSDERPVHTVTLTGFYMGKYPVTQEQYQAEMGALPSLLPKSAYGVGDNHPVYYVSWYDAIVFCNKLSIAEGLIPAYRISGSTNPADWGNIPTSLNNTWNAAEIVSGSSGYRLPTEAQWEYAAKGGNGTPGNYTYSGSDTVGDVAWYSSNSNLMSHEIGKKQPNSLGIYDMSGNVWEWCWDWWGNYPNPSIAIAQRDPAGPASGSNRVLRGGSWSYNASDARSVSRIYFIPDLRNASASCGFRVVRPL